MSKKVKRLMRPRKRARRPRREQFESLVGARMPDDLATDPFEVIGKTPKGKSYQWVTVSVAGDTTITQHQLARMKAAGWKPVPAKRHPKMPRNKRGQIEVLGQLLMERSEARTLRAQKEETAKADALMRSQNEAMMGPNGAGGTTAPVVGEPPTNDPARLVAAKEELDSVAGLYFVDITLGIVISEHEIETAVCVLGLEPVEYMRRRIIMDTSALVRAGDSLALINPALIGYQHPIFQRAEIKAHVVDNS